MIVGKALLTYNRDLLVHVLALGVALSKSFGVSPSLSFRYFKPRNEYLPGAIYIKALIALTLSPVTDLERNPPPPNRESRACPSTHDPVSHSDGTPF